MLLCARRNAENLNTSRSARVASFVANGHTQSGEVGFASTDDVLRDARKAGSPDGTRDQEHRRLSHDGWLGRDGSTWHTDIQVSIEGTNCEAMCQETCEHSSDGGCDDGGRGSEYSYCSPGTDCADCGARIPEADDCYFQMTGDYKSFRAGNRYKLVMTFPSGVKSWDDDDGGWGNWWDDDDDSSDDNHNQQKIIEIKFWEHDLIRDDYCLKKTSNVQSTSAKTYYFDMPDLNNNKCSGDGTGGFDEYKIEVVTNRGKHRGYSEFFRVLYEEGVSAGKSFPAPGYTHSKWEWPQGGGNA